MKVKIKKLQDNAVIPYHSKPGDAGLDLTAVSLSFNEQFTEYGTGIAIEVPEGFVGLVFPRSSLSKMDLILANHVGVIDPNYRGEIKLRFKKHYHTGNDDSHTDECEYCEGFGQIDTQPELDILVNEEQPPLGMDCPVCDGIGEYIQFEMYQPGDKIGQLLIIRREEVEFEEVEDLSDTNRGDQGFGSSGN